MGNRLLYLTLIPCGESHHQHVSVQKMYCRFWYTCERLLLLTKEALFPPLGQLVMKQASATYTTHKANTCHFRLNILLVSSFDFRAQRTRNGCSSHSKVPTTGVEKIRAFLDHGRGRMIVSTGEVTGSVSAYLDATLFMPFKSFS